MTITSASFTAKLFENQIEDEYSQENFKRLKIFLRDNPLLKSGFVFREIPANAGGSQIAYKHNLGFIPRDVLMTSVTKGATVVWNYDLFDADFVYFTPSASCTIRAFFGTYKDLAT